MIKADDMVVCELFPGEYGLVVSVDGDKAWVKFYDSDTSDFMGLGNVELKSLTITAMDNK